MTELQTIEVRYEDQSGRHVDVHEAAREGRHGDGTFIVSNGLCACCEATEETTAYSEDNIVKVEYEPSDHYRVEIDEPSLYEVIKPLVLFVLSVVLVTAFVWVVVYGGEITL